ncbi:MAG: obg, GTPase obg [Candidatus Saccharibacteria bacterium]|nr:obg, GTPase obg [Candidatus Saccharibacteria bacterium]
MFVDKVKISLKAGDGGDGRVSFRQEKFIDRGGPDGGDGGKGGDVLFMGSRNQNTLAAFRYQKEVKAEDGRPGGKTRKHGRSGKDLIVAVPVGTVVTTEDGKILADLAADEQTVVIAAGGRGGFGNAHFVSSRRQAPKFAEKGEDGEAYESLVLELKMIADVALVGMPNAGKSTLLSVISNARPEIADYPFTTLTPNLGMVDVADTSLLFADVPGLIEGASNGKGLGHEFLRHVERTAVIVHMIDAYQDDVATTYKAIRQELHDYRAEIIDRPEIIAINKVEGLDEDMIADIKAQLQKVVNKGTPIFAISAQARQGLDKMLYDVADAVKRIRQEAAEMAETESDSLPVLTITNVESGYTVSRQDDNSFIVSGTKLESFAGRTDFENEEGMQRLRDILARWGVMHELRRQGIEPGDTIFVGRHGPMVY